MVPVGWEQMDATVEDWAERRDRMLARFRFDQLLHRRHAPRAARQWRRDLVDAVGTGRWQIGQSRTGGRSGRLTSRDTEDGEGGKEEVLGEHGGGGMSYAVTGRMSVLCSQLLNGSGLMEKSGNGRQVWARRVAES